MKRSLPIVLALSLLSSSALADIVYVTSLTQGCTTTSACPGANGDGTYAETGITLGFTSAKGSAAGRPITPGGCRAYLGGAVVTSTAAGVDVTPTLAFNSVYQIDYNWNASAANSSTDAVFSATCTGGTLSFTETALFARSNGVSATWKFMGYVTNTQPNPTISFRYQSGYISATGGYRVLFDCWRFTLLQPCLSVAVPTVNGPLAANSTAITVNGVSATATNVAIYQDAGSGMTNVGLAVVSSPGATVSVPVTGTLIKGAQVSATQKINGQESCIQTSGTFVGGGANPRVRVVYTIRETSSTGPVGAAGDTTSANLHFLGSSNVVSGSPGSGPVLYPSNTWQTLTLKRGSETVADSANAAGALITATGYAANDTVGIQVYAYKTFHGVTIYSQTPAQSSDVTSNDVFRVNWTWDAVPGAQGYRVLRQLNFGGYVEYQDVLVNNLADANTGWNPSPVVTPTATQTDTSIRWNPTIGALDTLPGQWGILESINFAIDDLTDSGPYDLYIDNLQNGTTVWQDFETPAIGAQDVSFRNPSFSGTTADNILGTPNQSIVSGNAADTGMKSLRIQFQWKGPLAGTKWLRLTTSGAGNPQVNLDDPISIRFLLLPVGSSPVPPTPLTLSIQSLNGQPVLNWTGTHQLQASPTVNGTYTNVPGVTAGPFTNTPADSQRYFRLVQ